MRLNLTPKKIGLINRLLQLQLSELFRTLTQASRSLLLLKWSEIKEREPVNMSQNVYVEQRNFWRQSRE